MLSIYSPGYERSPTLENDYLESDDRAPGSDSGPASAIPVAMAQHDNQQDVRTKCITSTSALVLVHASCMLLCVYF